MLGSFHKEGDPNVDPEILESFLLVTPKEAPLMLGNPLISKNPQG